MLTRGKGRALCSRYYLDSTLGSKGLKNHSSHLASWTKVDRVQIALLNRVDVLDGRPAGPRVEKSLTSDERPRFARQLLSLFF